MQEGRRALELEMAEADRKRRRQVDTEPDTEAPGADEPLGFETVSVTEAPPVWSAAAKLAVPPKDPDNPYDAWQVLDVTVELYDRLGGYVLTVVMPDGSRDALPPVETRDGWVAGAAYRGIKIADDADWAAFNALPLEHPVKERRAHQLEKWAQKVTPTTKLGEGSRREKYRDRDPRTGEFSTYSDGIGTWN
jgi:hypothetical protein